MNLSFLAIPINSKRPMLSITGPITLGSVPPGKTVVIDGYHQLDSVHQNYLQAYGITPGREVRVLQHAPETVVQVEHTELAFENEIANRVLVHLS